jgi:hypothetical protein
MNTKKKIKTLPSAYSLVKRYGVTAYILFLLIGLIVGVLNLNSIFQGPIESAAPSKKTNIDTTTVNSIKSLPKSNKSPSKQTLPTGRINPFSE